MLQIFIKILIILVGKNLLNSLIRAFKKFFVLEKLNVTIGLS